MALYVVMGGVLAYTFGHNLMRGIRCVSICHDEPHSKRQLLLRGVQDLPHDTVIILAKLLRLTLSPLFDQLSIAEHAPPFIFDPPFQCFGGLFFAVLRRALLVWAVFSA